MRLLYDIISRVFEYQQHVDHLNAPYILRQESVKQVALNRWIAKWMKIDSLDLHRQAMEQKNAMSASPSIGFCWLLLGALGDNFVASLWFNQTTCRWICKNSVAGRWLNNKWSTRNYWKTKHFWLYTKRGVFQQRWSERCMAVRASTRVFFRYDEKPQIGKPVWKYHKIWSQSAANKHCCRSLPWASWPERQRLSYFGVRRLQLGLSC